MKRLKKILLIIVVTFLLVTIISNIAYDFNYVRFFIFPIFLTFISTVSSVVISSLIKGQFIRSYFNKFFLYCHSCVLVIWFAYVITIYNENKNYWKIDNLEHNNNYKQFYGDSRDSNVIVSINSIENKFADKSVYRIYRIRVIEKDTFLNEKFSKFYDIHQIYFTDKFHYDTTTYVSRHLVSENKILKVVYDKPFLKDLTGRIELAICEEQIKEMFKDKTLDSLQKSITDFSLDIIKLTQ